MADQVGTVARIYAHFGHALTPERASGIGEYLAARPQGRHGGHDHSFADLGLDADVERKRFAEYQEYFGIPSEES